MKMVFLDRSLKQSLRSLKSFGHLSVLLSCVFLCGGCAYHIGFLKKQLPGGYNQVFIPIFKNKTQQVGAEVYFTNALMGEFHRSNNVRVQKSPTAPVTIEGHIETIQWTNSAIASAPSSAASVRRVPLLPPKTLLTIEYRVRVQVKVLLRKNSDDTILWQKTLAHEETYPAPQIGLETVNTSNPLYNYSARNKTLEKIAKNMMVGVHKQMLEDF